MTISQILTQLRNRLDDTNSSLWSDAELIDDYLNSSIDEFCERCFLLEETGSSISVTGSSDISFALTGKKITKTSGGFLTAGFYVGNTITISGTILNNGNKTIVTVSDTEIVVSEVLVNESNTSAVISVNTSNTRISIVKDTHSYSINESIIRINRAKLSSQDAPLDIIRNNSLDYMDYNHSGWESETSNTPSILLINGVGTNKVRLYPTPDADDTLYLSIYRYPISSLVSTATTTSPEIPSKYHNKLFNRVCWKAYMKQDADAFDAKQADKFLALSERDIEEIKNNLNNKKLENVICGIHEGLL
jgi:hypothetical protein